jgi:hypothetical protein
VPASRRVLRSPLRSAPVSCSERAAAEFPGRAAELRHAADRAGCTWLSAASRPPAARASGFGTSFGTSRAVVARMRYTRHCWRSRKSARLAGSSSDGETRTRTGDTTIFRHRNSVTGKLRFAGTSQKAIWTGCRWFAAVSRGFRPRAGSSWPKRRRPASSGNPRLMTSWVRSTSSWWRDGRERCRVARSSYWPPWGRSSRG